MKKKYMICKIKLGTLTLEEITETGYKDTYQEAETWIVNNVPHMNGDSKYTIIEIFAKL